MRKFLTTTETTGILFIEDLPEINVRCTYTDDHYSTRFKKGTFEILNFDTKTVEDAVGKKFKFEDSSGRDLKGRIIGFSHKTEYNEHRYTLNFTIEELLQSIKWTENEIVTLNIEFKIPYVELLSRDLRSSHGFYPDYIIKFDSEVLVLKVADYEIKIEERVNFVRNEDIKPNSIFNRELFPTISTSVTSKNYIDEINKIEILMDSVLLVVSFFLNHRINSFQFYAQLSDANSKNVETILYKNFKRGTCKDFLDSPIHEFNLSFQEDNLSKLINKFIERNKDKDIERLLNAFLSIDETRIFQPMFLSGYFVLEAISKIIVNPRVKMGSEDLISNAMEIAGINEDEISFIEPINGKKIKWHIYEYRNHLAHFNESELRDDLIYTEFEKIMKLNRKLILWYIEPTLRDIPFHIFYNNPGRINS